MFKLKKQVYFCLKFFLYTSLIILTIQKNHIKSIKKNCYKNKKFYQFFEKKNSLKYYYVILCIK